LPLFLIQYCDKEFAIHVSKILCRSTGGGARFENEKGSGAKKTTLKAEKAYVSGEFSRGRHGKFCFSVQPFNG